MEAIKVINNMTQNNSTAEQAPAKAYLVADHEIELHTNVARVLFSGNWRYGRMGLLQFATLMNTLWKAYLEDDPYAELYLLGTYDLLDETNKKLKNYEEMVQQQFNDLRGLKIGLYNHPEPLIRPLKFSTPFAFIAAMLIEKTDYLTRQLYTLNRIGLLPTEQLTASKIVGVVQAVFASPRKWKYTGITRKDIIEDNQKAQHVKKLLGEIPSTVLNKEIQFSFFPKIKEN